MSRVRLPSGQVLTIAATADVAQWQSALRRDYRRGDCVCLCVAGKDLPLTICRLRLGDAAETYYLRSHPSSSGDHMRICPFYTSPHAAAVSVLSDGDGAIRIEGGLRIRTLAERTAEPSTHNRSGSHSDTAETKLLQILRALWLEAGLHVWEPATARRSWKDIALLVDAIAQDVRTSEGRLADVLFTAVPGDAEVARAGADRFAKLLARARKRRTRLMIIGEIGAIDDVAEDRRAATLFIKGFPRGIMRLLWDQPLIDLTRTRFPSALALLRERPDESRVAAILTVNPHASDAVGFVHVLSLQAMTRSFTPVDSGFELDLARRLMAHDRHFRKPLAAEDGIMPDFELLDCEHAPYPLEVFGMNTPEYLQRKAEKIQRYERERGGYWWSWAPPGMMPDLPPATAATPNGVAS